MGTTAKRCDPELWEQVKDEITKGDKGGEPGQWSARKAQMAVQEYKKRGGSYAGEKSDDNALKEWTDEDWGTGSGERSRDSGERYLPKTARQSLSEDEYHRTSEKKRRDSRRGKQYSDQPEDVRKKTGKGGQGQADTPSKADLYAEAKRKGIAGRSKMTKAELRDALS